MKNGAINSTDFNITPTGTSTLTTDNLYSATFESKNGNPSNTFKYENLDVSDYDKAVVKYTIEAGNGDWEINLPSGSFTALPVGNNQTYEIDLSGVDTYSDFTVFSWFHTGKSITISEVYLCKNLIKFDENGKATTDKKYLTATGGLSYNSETGVITSDGTAGELTLELAAPVDLKFLNYFNVKRSGTDAIIDRLYFYDEDDTEINSWGYTKFDNTWRTPDPGCDDGATNAFLNHKPVKKLVWKAVANAENAGKTLTINSIEWTLKTISCSRAGETQLKTLAWNKIDGSGTATPDWNMNVATDTYYGNYSSDPTHYADLTDYEELRIYRDNNDGFRAFFINEAGNATNTISSANATWNAEEKYWSVDLSTIEKWKSKVALKSIKSASSGVNNIVKNIVVYNTPAANAPQYILNGSGMQLAETVAALADANATCIDATGVIGNTTNTPAGQTLLTSANPNCLFLGKIGNGYLANTKNVIDDGACAQLAITDGYPFKAPSTFTATAAPTYNRTFTEDKITTVCLPFDLTSGEASSLGTFYELSSVAGSKLTFTPVAAPLANKPYLVVPTETELDLTQTSKSIAATPASLSSTVSNIEFIGTLASTTIPASGGGTDYYAFNNGDLVKIEDTPATLPAFRGYLKVTGGTPVKGFTIQLDDETVIQSITNSQEPMANSEIYNLAGQRMSKLQKGVNIVNGKKILVK